MPRKTGHSRLQFGLFATPLDDMIAPDNPVRVIDAFAVMSILGVQGLLKALKEYFSAFFGLRRRVEPVRVGILSGALGRREAGGVPIERRA